MAALAERVGNGRLAGADDPVRVYLVCWRVLTAGQDERAPHLLQQGRRLLQTWTAKISDPQRRQRFLENIPSHRAMNAVCDQLFVISWMYRSAEVATAVFAPLSTILSHQPPYNRSKANGSTADAMRRTAEADSGSRFG